MIAQGEVWWADLAEPLGSEPGYRRPVIVVQGDAFNASRLRTVVCVGLTSNLRWADAPGNVRLSTRATGLPKASVAKVTQLVTLDREVLTERAGRLSASNLALVLAGIDTLLGRGRALVTHAARMLVERELAGRGRPPRVPEGSAAGRLTATEGTGG